MDVYWYYISALAPVAAVWIRDVVGSGFLSSAPARSLNQSVVFEQWLDSSISYRSGNLNDVKSRTS